MARSTLNVFIYFSLFSLGSEGYTHIYLHAHHFIQAVYIVFIP
jgi:hypothetical protein